MANPKTITVTVSASLLLLLGLTGCGSATGWVDEEARIINLPDGKSVVCVVITNASSGSSSVDCNWK